ncbi:LysR family transcriptional regulator [Leucothrix arctica]|uniref:LysR family transcriptional regulator n=1 Tax=Leucothrix arctica TaxID=1481894 RepID=A0A317CCL1_9GAMM|nr:LysR family transcriptional regulator [Leucothrix arctica]PWQ96286.1 LysR family transcriptional regulator [Leucothrix arctica]
MESKVLRYFCAVVDCGSFTGAAAALSIAQPAISMSIKRLEQEVGFPLFNRLERRLSLTDEGEVLYRHAKTVTQRVDDARNAMNELQGLESGLVRVGIPGMLGSYHFPSLLMAFRHRYPDIKLSIVDAGTVKLQSMLEQGEVDLAFVESDTILPSLEGVSIMQVPMVAAVAEDHRFASRPTIGVEEFLREELAIFKPGYFHRQLIDQLAEKAGIELNVSIETNLIPLMKSFVRQGFGITAFLDIVLQEGEGLVAIPFTEDFLLDIQVAWRKQGYLSMANRAFRDFMIEESHRGSPSLG